MFGWGGPVSVVWEGRHGIGQAKAFPRVNVIRKVAPNDLAGGMAPRSARPRVGPARKVGPDEVDGACGQAEAKVGILAAIWAILAFLGSVLAPGHLLSGYQGAQSASFEHIGAENGLETRILSV